jgi:outer membrane immunogenic protein
LTLFDIAAAHAQTPPAFSWTGFYVGAHAGYRGANVDGSASFGGFPVVDASTGGVSFPIIDKSVSLNPNGGIFGFQGGHNVLVRPNFLIGFEGDVSWGKASASNAFTLTDLGTGAVSSNFLSAQVDWSASIRWRFGYVSGPWLFYGTGGFSFLHMNVSGAGGFSASGSPTSCDFDSFCTFSTSGSSTFSLSKTFAGLVVGAGVERQLDNHWMIRIEYLFADYGRVNFGDVVIKSTYTDNFNCFCTVNATSIGNVSAHVTTTTLRVGISTKIP